MAKEALTDLKQVKALREANKSGVLNNVQVEKSSKATLLNEKQGGATTGRANGFSADVANLFAVAKNNGTMQLSHSELCKLYYDSKNEAMPTDKAELSKTLKKFYEHCLAKSDQPSKKCKAPLYHYDSEVKKFSLI